MVSQLLREPSEKAISLLWRVSLFLVEFLYRCYLLSSGNVIPDLHFFVSLVK